MLIDHMGDKGLSFESFAPVVGVNQDTLHHWAKIHADFSEAKNIAFAKNLLFWEKIGAAGMVGQIPGFNATVWIFNMKNRHRWRDRTEVDAKLSGAIDLHSKVVQIVEGLESDRDPAEGGE